MAKKRGKSRKKAKPGLVTKLRGIMYVATKGVPAARIMWINKDNPVQGATNVLYNQFGMRPDGSFDTKILAEQWGPLALWTVSDTVLSKTGMYKRISKTINSIFK